MPRQRHGLLELRDAAFEASNEAQERIANNATL